MSDILLDLTNFLGVYTPVVGRNGMDAIDYTYIIRAGVLLLSLWFFYRLILNFCNGLFKGGK